MNEQKNLSYNEALAKERSLPLFGEEGIAKLKRATVAVIGLGGVGGHAAEALCRAGIGKMYLIDGDEFSWSNLNRQRFANIETIGKSKAEIVAKELALIHPNGTFLAVSSFVTPETLDEFPLKECDYVVDAIDQVRAKTSLITYCVKNNIPIISSMGTGNKLDPTLLRVTDLAKTEMDALAKKMRTELKKEGIRHLKVVFSPEPNNAQQKEGEPRVLASSPFVPSTAGILIAKEVTLDLLKKE